MTNTMTRRVIPVATTVVAAATVAAFAAGLAPAAGATTPTRAHSSLSIRANHGVLTAGQQDAVGGQLRVHGLDGAGRTVVLEARSTGSHSFARIDSATTGANGVVGFTVHPGSTTRYQLRFAGDGTAAASRSAVATVHVRKAAHRASTTLDLTAVVRHPSGEAETAIGGRLLSHGHGLAGRTVVLREKAAGASGYTDAETETSRAHGYVAFAVTPDSTTHYRLLFRGSQAFRPSLSRTVDVGVSSPVATTGS